MRGSTKLLRDVKHARLKVLGHELHASQLDPHETVSL